MTYSSKWLLVGCLAIGNALLLFAVGLVAVHSLSLSGWSLSNHSLVEMSNQVASAICYVQFTLLAALGVLGPGRARDRWFVVGSVGYLLLLAIPQVFAQRINPSYTLDAVYYFSLHCLIVFSLTCLLLAPVSRMLGWQFYCEGTDGTSATGRSFSLFRLLTWTTLVAVILGLLKATYGNGILMQIRPGFEAIGSILPILIPVCILLLGKLPWTRALTLVSAWTLLLPESSCSSCSVGTACCLAGSARPARLLRSSSLCIAPP
jgi:hypothetical protein